MLGWLGLVILFVMQIHLGTHNTLHFYNILDRPQSQLDSYLRISQPSWIGYNISCFTSCTFYVIFFGNLTYGNPILIYDCGQFLERCCRASSRSLTSCQQSPKTLDAYMKSRKQLKSPNIMCKYFYLRAVRKLAWLMECLYSEDQIQLSRRKLAVGTSGCLPNYYFNIYESQDAFCLWDFDSAHCYCASTSTGFRSLARLDS